MGELLNSNGADATETRTAAPRLGAGMSTLVRSPGEPAAPTRHTPSLTVLRVSLLVADGVLVSGAVLYSLGRPAADWTATGLASLAVLLGGWLGWLGLTWGRAAR